MAKRYKRRACSIFAIWSSALIIAAAITGAKSIEDWAHVSNLGATFSVYSYGQAPYNRSAPFLNFKERVLFSEGAQAFTIPPRMVEFASNLVPAANANAPSCGSCHFKDGRGRTHSVEFRVTGFSVANRSHHTSNPIFRRPAATDTGAARLTGVRWVVAERVVLSGGETIELVKPVALVDGVEQPVDLRNAPGVYGLGLLESISDADIIARAQDQAYDRLGITGLVPVARDAATSFQVGRFGWKATFATISDQVRHAVKTELGIVDQRHSKLSGHEDPEFTNLVEHITNYLRLLAVPARRLNGGTDYRHGAKLFSESGCATCHAPSWQTGQLTASTESHQNLTIFPFTDMLLHDMGHKLSDLSGTKLGRHWRTAPLWGIGVQHGVSQEVGFLHDGRARTFTEAILWHSGEAQHAVDRFKAMDPKDRAVLIAFLFSL